MGNQVFGGDVAGTVYVSGDVVIHGNVKAGAHVRVSGGSIKIDGNVGDGAIVETAPASKSMSVGGARTTGNSSPIIMGSTIGSITIDGNDVSKPKAGGGDITIDGMIGNHAIVSAGHNLHAAGVGHKSTLEAKGSVMIDSPTTPADTRITAQGPIITGHRHR